MDQTLLLRNMRDVLHSFIFCQMCTKFSKFPKFVLKKLDLYICEDCKFQFTHPDCLQRHKVKHVIERMGICPMCGKEFEDRDDTELHVMVKHVSMLLFEMFICRGCDKLFNIAAHHEHHLLKHIGERTYSCKMCGKTLVGKEYLRRHMRLHNVRKVLDYYFEKHNSPFKLPIPL